MWFGKSLKTSWKDTLFCWTVRQRCIGCQFKRSNHGWLKVRRFSCIRLFAVRSTPTLTVTKWPFTCLWATPRFWKRRFWCCLHTIFWTHKTVLPWLCRRRIWSWACTIWRKNALRFLKTLFVVKGVVSTLPKKWILLTMSNKLTCTRVLSAAFVKKKTVKWYSNAWKQPLDAFYLIKLSLLPCLSLTFCWLKRTWKRLSATSFVGQISL